MSAHVSPMLSTEELLDRIRHAYRKAEDGKATYKKLIPEWYDRIGDRRTAAGILEKELGIAKRGAYKLLPPPPEKPQEKQGDAGPEGPGPTDNVEEKSDDGEDKPSKNDQKIIRDNQINAFRMNASLAANAAHYEGPVTDEVLSACRATYAAWAALLREMEKQNV